LRVNGILIFLGVLIPVRLSVINFTVALSEKNFFCVLFDFVLFCFVVLCVCLLFLGSILHWLREFVAVTPSAVILNHE
jgi:hypothetical protein